MQTPVSASVTVKKKRGPCPPHHWLCGDTKDGVTPARCRKCKARTEYRITEETKLWSGVVPPWKKDRAPVARVNTVNW